MPSDTAHDAGAPGASRGVTVVEYALVIALVLIPALIAIARVQDTAEAKITEHGASAGAPDLPDAGIPVTTSTTAVPPSASTTTTAAPGVNATAAFGSTSLGINNNRWSPRVDVHAIDSADNSVLTGVTITVTWTEVPSGDTTTQSCAVPSTGVCTFQLNNLERRESHPQLVDAVQVSVTSITSSSQTITYTPDSASITLDSPNAP